MQKIYVMVNGLPGNMAFMVARHLLRDGRFELAPRSLTGPEIQADTCTVDGFSIRLVHPEDRKSATDKGEKPAVAVDYTHPNALNANAVWYCENGIHFVMGTTGGDRQKLEETVRASSVSAVIAPNMAKQIVAFQSMMEYGATHFPMLFKGYTLEIRESHQKGKADTSGTAKAMVAYFNQLGVPFSEDRIQKEREPKIQETAWGIPSEHLAGHGWHTYSLTSPDRTVHFEFTHNVNGREIYALGTLDAVLYLNRKALSGAKGKVFSMVDVLQGT